MVRIAPYVLELRWRLFRERLRRSKSAILIGPWRSEIGFEVLYWIPFINKLRTQLQLDPNRLITLGRGGSAAWYRTNGQGDLYEHAPMEMMRTIALQEAQHTGSIKQRRREKWERGVCDLAAQSCGCDAYIPLSPWWMYQMLAPYWEGTQPLSWLDHHLTHEMQMTAPPLPSEIAKQLPDRFIAMRWYARPTWPLREDLHLWTRRLVEAVSSHIPVVLIQSGFHADDHADINLGAMKNVIELTKIAPQTPLNNLAIQSAVIAKAQGYVGTYGGMSQLAMRFGVPTVALYHDFKNTSPQHLYLTQALSLRTGVPFIATYPKAVDALLPILLQKKQLEADA